MNMFAINWEDLSAVKELADKFGPGMIVFKMPNRPNYNITHSEKENMRVAVGATIIYRT